MPQRKTKKLQLLFEAMLKRTKVTVKNNNSKEYEGQTLIMQRMSLDGEIDIYSFEEDDVVMWDVNPKDITIKK